MRIKEMLQKIVFHNQHLSDNPADLTDEESGMFRQFWTVLDRELEIDQHKESSTSPVEDFHRTWDDLFILMMQMNDELSHIDDRQVDQHLKEISKMVEMLHIYWELEKRS